MTAVSTDSYIFNVNRHHTDIMEAKRGLRQGDPISLMLFVIVMECLNRYLYKMQKDGDFNYHPKCDKLIIINLYFADDILLFSRGDNILAEMMMAYKKFSKAKGLVVNPQKCRLYYACIDVLTQRDILEASGFQEGQLPFKYLGVHVTRRLQLINSVMFVMTNYWLNCFPLPKSVLQKIDTISRIFLRTSGFDGSRKAPVAWKQICRHISHGGLNFIDIEAWNKTNLMKLLWNLSEKEDSLWVKWIQAYYVKNNELIEMESKISDSWIMKDVLN
ncbi:uncharacterized protein LOC131614945 [Vicia villosa]|uniref:uncharacterized protein LOC131614945 n=1 Tax=Vicia villosa TaxID=3911 RepID=UPI00273AFA18|nr:uncharacterized protein LOC131614945 [Vicia villosa]